ncbi:MAG: hypothetical protein PF495_18595 [Spirochaetales bacterium]|jgi:hypothetical protein|nr:hypothetical protein [Spirochaetales bacterium]
MKRIKTALIIMTLLLIFTGCISQTTPKTDDGYYLYTQACAFHESHGLTWGSPDMIELNKFLKTGGVPSDTVVRLLKQEKKAFSLILNAHKTVLWNLPDNTSFSYQTRSPSIGEWLGINLVAAAQGIKLYQDKRPQEVLRFLTPFNTTGLKISGAGTLTHIITHIASRTIQYPVMISSIDDLPVEVLARELVDAKEQYALIPTVGESMVGEQHMAINTVTELFADIRQDENLKNSRQRMIQDLTKQAVEKSVLERISDEKILSISQWEAQVISDLKRLQLFYTNVMSTCTSAELLELNDEMEKKIDEIGSEMDYKAAIDGWNLFITNQVSGAFSMPDAERLHKQVGKEISRSFLRMMISGVGTYGLTYRRYIASERLLLIRLAVRLYDFQEGENPSSLQQLVDKGLLNAEVIIDPVSGKTFLTVKNKPIEAYSVDKDLDDDGGALWDNKIKSGDLILIPLEKKWSLQQDKSSVSGEPER